MQIQVPLFQRQYVWTLELQWQPLWEDIERKFREQLDGRSNAPVHFLGAMVLDQRQTGTIDIDRRQIIDGQQRLTTLQIILAAFRDLCEELNVDDVRAEVAKYVINDGILPKPEVDQFKVWPTQLDQGQFADVILAGSRDALTLKHPLNRRKYSQKFERRPPMVEAYEYFYQVLLAFFTEPIEDFSEHPTYRDRLLKCLGALKNTLRVVAIDLQQDDDPQVIFETLNARGVPLLPADLLRNFIFLRASRERASDPALPAIESLYEKYWKPFDDPFWRQLERQGRYQSARSDLFIQHFVSSQSGEDTSVKHLFVEYKNLIDSTRPFGNVTDELKSLARQRDVFARLISPTPNDILSEFANFVKAFDTSTVFPLLLFIFETKPTDADVIRYVTLLECYLLRRAVCNLTAKAYNRLFLSAIRELQRGDVTPKALSEFLRRQTSETALWPDDAAFKSAWLSNHAYRTLTNAKIVFILSKINATYRSNKTEIIENGQLTVEHLMPQSWLTNWPLASGERGLSHLELPESSIDDSIAQATRNRDSALQTIGNLTLITQPLNAAISNGAWAQKLGEILHHSNLPINQRLRYEMTWDEESIKKRSLNLFESAQEIWPRL